MSRIYVASSWRNEHQPEVVAALRSNGHEVYDFRHPAADNKGFSWSEINPWWQKWSTEQFINGLIHPLAESGYKYDIDAMEWADTLVMVQPCGRSAHLEAGWAKGRGKLAIMYIPPGVTIEPELMVKMFDRICTSIFEVLESLR